MKPVFGFDTTEDKSSEKTYSDLFITKKQDEKVLDELNSSRESLETTLEDSKLPVALRIAQYLGLFIGLMITGPMIGVDGGIAQAIRNAPLLCLSGIFALIIGVMLWIFSLVKSKRVLTESNAVDKVTDLKEKADKAYRELGVPDDAVCVDIIGFIYFFKDEKLKIRSSALSITPYSNPIVKAYLKDYNLCLADVETVYSFPLESMRSIQTVKKSIILPEWNKDEAYNKGEFKQYKLSKNDYGIICKKHHILELEREGELYGIYFPNYELPVFERLTRLSATEESAQEKDGATDTSDNE